VPCSYNGTTQQFAASQLGLISLCKLGMSALPQRITAVRQDLKDKIED